METYLEISGNQIDGARDYQEDAFMITHLGEGADAQAEALIIMADGMGGHAAGNVASNLVTSTFNKAFSGSFPTDDVPGALKAALGKANDAIGEAVKETPGLKGMGCTMVTAFISRGRLWWISVGDSHLYLLRDREILKLNADHSYGGFLKRMREQGMDVEADSNLSPNMLMSAMIGEEIAEIDVPEQSYQLLPEDRLLVASDGLDTLGQGAIIQYAAWSSTPRECVKALLDAVEAANQPRQDNTTVICIDVKRREGSTRADLAVARTEAEEQAPETDEAEETTEPKAVREAREAEEARAAAEAEQAPTVEEMPTEEQEPSGGKGLIIGVALVVLLALLGGAAYFLLAGGGEPAPDTVESPVVEQPPVEPPVVKQPPVEPPAVKQPPVEGPVEPPPEAPVVEVGIKPGSVFRDTLKGGSRGPEMVMLPGGKFQMGGRASSLNRDELPDHEVTVAPFAMNRYEVTYAEYAVFARATGRKLPPDHGWDQATHPVVNVSWDDAYAYAKWLSRETGEHYRLASESEWEYAARAGTTTDFWWGRQVGREHAHCFDCKSGLHPRKPAKVGFFKPNPFGLYDTAGNVMEWVHDCYHLNYKDAPEDGSVWEGGDCTRRVVRGGSYSSPSSALRAGKREKLVSNKGYDNVGIRLARDP